MCMLAVSCWQEVDFGLFTKYYFINKTEHNIKFSTIHAAWPSIEGEIKAGETYSSGEIESNILPQVFNPITVTFDDRYTVSYYPKTENGGKHNLCNPSNYIRTTEGKHENIEVYTYTFTEGDYEYAVSVNEAEKQ